MLVLSSPVHFSLELTPHCNNACPGCGNVFADRAAGAFPPSPLRARDWKTILALITPHARRIRLTGGEPSLHPDFFAILTTIADLQVPFSIFTNGRWPAPDRFVSGLCSTPHLAGLLISLHGADQASHEQFTGVSGSFSETIDNIQRSTRARLNVNTNTVITSLIAEHVAEIVDFSHSLGAQVAVFNRYLEDPHSPLQPSQQQLKAAVQTIDRLIADKRSVVFGNCIPQCFHSNGSHGCLAGIASCTIDPWGNVRPCNHAPETCGNLLREPLEIIWNGPQMASWRASLPYECRECPLLSACHGGCRVMARQHALGRDPLLQPGGPRPDVANDRLVLPADSYPLGRFDVFGEPFGYVLAYQNQLVPVAASATPVLASLDGQTSLYTLNQLYGDPALRLIGYLWKKGFITLNSSPE